MIKFGTRYYDPTLGTWTQTDPTGQGTNHDIYAGDNPTTFTDPNGRLSISLGGRIRIGISVCGSFSVGNSGLGPASVLVLVSAVTSRRS